MKIILFLFLSLVSCFGQLNIGNAIYPPILGRFTIDVCSSCSNETFNTTAINSYDLYPNWTSFGGGTIDPDYTVTILEGAESLLLRNVAFARSGIKLPVPDVLEGWQRFMFRVTNTYVDTQTICQYLDTTSAECARVDISGTGNLKVWIAGNNVSTTSAISVNTTYYCWFHFLSGGSGSTDVAFSTVKNRPTSGNNFAEAFGNKTNHIQFVGPIEGTFSSDGTVTGIVYDKWSYSSSGPIGDFP